MQGFDITSIINTIKSFYPDKIEALYLQLLNYFPAQFQAIVSIVFALLFIYAIIRIIKKDFIFIGESGLFGCWGDGGQGPVKVQKEGQGFTFQDFLTRGPAFNKGFHGTSFLKFQFQ